MFDSHNHLQNKKFSQNSQRWIEEMRAAGISGCVVNATHEGDWDSVAQLARDYPEYVFPAYGIHPWFADTAQTGWQERLMARLEENPHATLGECGLDQWVKAPSMHCQMPIFLDQVKIAATSQRIMTVHCLKAWQELFAAIRESPIWPEKMLLHSYGGSIETARQLEKHGAWFSFSGYFLGNRKSKVIDTFRQLPIDRILIETDAPEMLAPAEWVQYPLENGMNHPANLLSTLQGLEQKLAQPMRHAIQKNGLNFWNFPTNHSKSSRL